MREIKNFFLTIQWEFHDQQYLVFAFSKKGKKNIKIFSGENITLQYQPFLILKNEKKFQLSNFIFGKCSSILFKIYWKNSLSKIWTKLFYIGFTKFSDFFPGRFYIFCTGDVKDFSAISRYIKNEIQRFVDPSSAIPKSI